mgnify:CR=1 FL=1
MFPSIRPHGGNTPPTAVQEAGVAWGGAGCQGLAGAGWLAGWLGLGWCWLAGLGLAGAGWLVQVAGAGAGWHGMAE